MSPYSQNYTHSSLRKKTGNKQTYTTKLPKFVISSIRFSNTTPIFKICSIRLSNNKLRVQKRKTTRARLKSALHLRLKKRNFFIKCSGLFVNSSQRSNETAKRKMLQNFGCSVLGHMGEFVFGLRPPSSKTQFISDVTSKLG